MIKSVEFGDLKSTSTHNINIILYSNYNAIINFYNVIDRPNEI